MFYCYNTGATNVSNTSNVAGGSRPVLFQTAEFSPLVHDFVLQTANDSSSVGQVFDGVSADAFAVCVYVFMYVCVCVFMYVFMYVFMHVCMCVFMYVFMHVCMYVHIWLIVHLGRGDDLHEFVKCVHESS